MSYFNELYGYTEAIPAVMNTHSHMLDEKYFADISLHKLFQYTYTSWQYSFLQDTQAERKRFIDTMCTNTYYRWMAKSIERLYNGGQTLSLNNWDDIDSRIRTAYVNPQHRFDILRGSCRYKSIVLDKYENPGHDLGHPKLMRPAFRCDMFLSGYLKEGCDQNKNCPFDYIGGYPDSLAEYVEQMKRVIKEKATSGSCCIKLAIAYERGLDFEPVSKETAAKAYLNPNITPSQIKAFGDYIMFCLAEAAAELSIPMQIHTGLGKLQNSGAIHLLPLIQSNPDTTFVLFHCGYPWTQDVLALVHNFRNVTVDLCWLPLISTTAASAFLKEALEVADTLRICWGCDTWTAEESFGALLAVRYVLAASLDNLCSQNAISSEQSRMIITNILYKNASAIYKLD